MPPNINLQKLERKSRIYINKYRGEFVISLNGKLICNLCFKEVHHKRKSLVDEHKAGKKHQSHLNINLNTKSNQAPLIC